MILFESDSKTWIVLIHGLGVSEKVWFEPLGEKVLFISFRTLLKNEKEIIPFADRLKGRYNIASWTQDEKSTIDEAAGGLKKIVSSLPSRDYIIIAHSRGGLVARRAIQQYRLTPRVLICLSTPHHGSRFADIVMRYSRLISFAVPSIKRFLVPIGELCTDSEFIREINSSEKILMEKDIPHFDIYGDNVTYIKKGPFDIIGSLKTISGESTPYEWRQGYGDGFVATGSSVSPVTPEANSYCLPVNHLNILIDNRVWDIVNKILARFC